MKTSTTIAAIILGSAIYGATDICAQRTPVTFSEVYTPSVPSSVKLCGETIDLDPVDRFERLDRELASIAYTHGTTMLIIKRANQYFPELSKLLKENNVPQDLLYLACVESTLNPRAYSPAKAAGLWQFIASTAKQYGLEVNDEIDERYNIEKATAAAAKYMKKAYAQYGNWPSVMAAYNGGMARISGELDKQDADTSLDLYLVEETTRYPYRIMAMKMIMENPSAYGFHLRDDQLYQPRKYRVVEVNGPVESWPKWAAKQGINYSILREENPWIRAKTLTNKLGKTYKVRIPLPESLSRKTAGTKNVQSQLDRQINSMVNDTIDGTDCISVVGARVNNLKNVDIDIPHNKLTVITGLSGSGKSSLAFDTIFAEGQRRYIETFSAYARNMLGNLERPDVDHIGGLCPVIAIEQKTINRNPRSTIGTTTEIYDFLRLLYARAGHARSYLSGEEMVKYTDEKIVELILQKYDGRKIYILAPLVKNRKGHYRELFEQLVRKGFLNVRVDGELKEISGGMRLDRYKNHSIELVIDRLKVSAKDAERLLASVENALTQGDKELMVYDVEADTAAYYSQELMDPSTGISYHDPAPHNFSFNSPQGACPRCKGLGYVNLIDRAKMVPDEVFR